MILKKPALLAKKPPLGKMPVRRTLPAPSQPQRSMKDSHSHVVEKVAGLERSKLAVMDIPITLLVAHKENPNEQSEKTFNELVSRIKEDGFDEPIIVTPQIIKGKPTGKYIIFSGHHRVKAAELIGMTVVPGIIREGWNEDRIALELITRNGLTGHMNPYKFTELFDRLKKRYDPEELKQMMGLTEKKQFQALYKQVRDQLAPKQKAALDSAKETITSVEDLSSVLNTIFKNHGSETDHSLMILSYGGKKHTYITLDADTQKRLEAIQGRLVSAERASDFFKELLANGPAVDNAIAKVTGNGDT